MTTGHELDRLDASARAERVDRLTHGRQLLDRLHRPHPGHGRDVGLDGLRLVRRHQRAAAGVAEQDHPLGPRVLAQPADAHPDLGERVVVLSKSPTWVQEDLAIDLAPERDQITTRALPRFTELRTHVYEQIQRAKRGEAVRPTA